MSLNTSRVEHQAKFTASLLESLTYALQGSAEVEVQGRRNKTLKHKVQKEETSESKSRHK